MSALASPASLKGVLSARDAAAFLAEGFRRGGTEAVELPIADGGEGTAEVLGARARERVHVTDAFGRELLVCLGGTATVDGGEGLREALDELPAPTTVLCDAIVPLRDAARRFAAQKGATPEQAELLERRLASMTELAPYAELPGAGAAGGLGAALASLGAELVPGAQEVLERLRFRERVRKAGVVVTGEGAVDGTTATGKAPGEALRVCLDQGVRCVVFGGRVEVQLSGAEMIALSGDPARAADDLVELGERLSGQP